MNNRYAITLSLALQLLVLILGGCTDGLGLTPETAGDRVRFAPTVSEINDLRPTAATRAMAAKHVVRLSRPDGAPQLYLHIEPALEMGDSRRHADGTRALYTTNNTISKLYFTIFKENDPAGQPFVDKGLTTKEDNWITGTEWPHGSGQMFKVYSVSPYEPSFTTYGSVINEQEVNYNTPPRVTYEMPDIAKQEDIVYAESDPLDPEASHAITMNYRHMLSGIALAEGSMLSGLKLRKVEIKGLYAKGTCQLSKDNMVWTIDEAVKKDFTIIKDYTAVGQNSALITPTNSAELMVIPQTAPQGASITVTLLLPNGSKRTLTASLAGTKFERGVVYWLLISTNALNWKYTLNVTTKSFDMPYDGGTAPITVNSWRTTANSDGATTTQEAVPFKVEYSEDGTTWTSTKPAWLTGVPAYVNGAMSSETYITTSGQTATTQKHSANLQSKPAVTNYDLSLHDVSGKELGAQCTANCYVIHGPGTYRLPCVYGNTLKLGAYNGYAVDDLNQSGQGGAFVDYTGTRISEKTYRFSPSSADVLWQSPGRAVTNPPVVTTGSDGMSYITFTVNKEGLQPGNAVIAAHDVDGTVMWSWHLWITDAKLQSTATDFLTQNLGWVSSNDSYNHYPARSVQLRISQTDALSDAAPVIITVNQTEADVEADPSSGSCLYYQWGRKDPFRGSDITTKYSWLITERNQAPLYLSIQYPTTPILYYYYYSSNYYDRYDWTSDHYNVLWNARYSTQQVIRPVEKSVYDPSPYGFRAPRGRQTSKEIFSSLPNMGYYSLDRDYDYWNNYYITVPKYIDTKYYWTSRANNNATPASDWVGFIVSSDGYDNTTYCSSLLPLRPYKDTESGSQLQSN